MDVYDSYYKNRIDIDMLPNITKTDVDRTLDFSIDKMKEYENLLESAIEKLSEKQQIVIKMHLAGLNYSEIARETGVSPQAIFQAMNGKVSNNKFYPGVIVRLRKIMVKMKMEMEMEMNL